MKKQTIHFFLKKIRSVLKFVLHWSYALEVWCYKKQGREIGMPCNFVMWVDRKISDINWFLESDERNAKNFAMASYIAERADWTAID